MQNSFIEKSNKIQTDLVEEINEETAKHNIQVEAINSEKQGLPSDFLEFSKKSIKGISLLK
jgi:hypothetical protein